MSKTFIPFYRPFFSSEELKNLKRVLQSGWLTTGKETRAFESEFSRYTKASYSIGVNSCTAGMHLSLVSMGVGKGDIVLTSPFTFASTANVILHSGADVRFVDINEEDFTIDLQKLEGKITPRVKAVIPVHYAGSVCDLTAITKMRKKYGVKVVQDAAHAVEAKWKGKHISQYGDTACYSFYATKNITTGEGGMVTTGNKALAEKIRIMSLHGLSRNAWNRYEKKGSAFYRVLYPGFKYNMFDVQSAIGRAQLKKIRMLYKKRKAIDALYRKLLIDVDGIRFQNVPSEATPAYHLFVVDLNTKQSRIKRDVLIDLFHKNNIGHSVHFMSLHMHPYYKDRYRFKENSFPVAARLSKEIISLPFFPELKEKDVRRVVTCIKKAYKK